MTNIVFFNNVPIIKNVCIFTCNRLKVLGHNFVVTNIIISINRKFW